MRFKDNIPIYIQIMDDIKCKIISGAYQKGQKIESSRDLASIYQVNPNTIQKVLLELDRIQVLCNKRTTGRFITEDESVIENLKELYAKQCITECICKLKAIGLESNEILEKMKWSLKE